MSVATVTEIREFNRFYTRILGLLRPKLAGSAFGLTEARVLFELAHSDQPAVTDLRRALDLDAGYLSRILSRFIADGLVEREPSATDGRRQLVRLTSAGRSAFAETDTLQADAIDRLVAPLDEDQRSRLVSILRTCVRSSPLTIAASPIRLVASPALSPSTWAMECWCISATRRHMRMTPNKQCAPVLLWSML